MFLGISPGEGLVLLATRDQFVEGGDYEGEKRLEIWDSIQASFIFLLLSLFKGFFWVFPHPLLSPWAWLSSLSSYSRLPSGIFGTTAGIYTWRDAIQ